VRWQAQRDTALDSKFESAIPNYLKSKALSRCACHRTPELIVSSQFTFPNHLGSNKALFNLRNAETPT
jgi:hypothetical protein